MNKIELPRDVQSTNIPEYSIVNSGTTVRKYIGVNKNKEPLFKDLPVMNVGPDGILCSDDDLTFISWDKLERK